MNPLTEIISKLEKATGPDRELDGQIALAIGWTFVALAEQRERKAWWREPGAEWFSRREKPPHFTGSIDSALTLVPEGKYWEVAFGLPTPTIKTRYWGQVYGDQDAYDLAHPICHGATPAIALCIASLKAIAALRSRGEQ